MFSKINPQYFCNTFLFLFITFTSTVYATDYFVDATNGDDSFLGTTESNAWQTVDRVNSELTSGNIIAGDRILFKKDEVWRGRLYINASGDAVNPITFGNYGSGTNNPLIMRTQKASWWEHSVIDSGGGFEKFFDDNVSLVTPDFPFPWNENRGVGAFIEVDTDPANSYAGANVAKLTRQDTGSDRPRLRAKKTLAQDTQYYLRFSAKSDGSAPLTVRIYDDGVAGRALQLDGTWSTTPTTLKSILSTDYQEYTLDFTTEEDSAAIDIRFEILDGSGSAWVDEVVLFEGNDEPGFKIWRSRIIGVDYPYGLVDQGIRRPGANATGPDPEVLELGGFMGIWGRDFAYRNDDVEPVDAEVGRWQEAIIVAAQNHIVIDGIDAYGPGAKFIDDSSISTGLIFITPSSSFITAKNLNVTHSSNNGISAGIFTYTDNPHNILYENIHAYNNESTGIYIRGSGAVKNSSSHNNGNLANDRGDRGGIGLQEGPTIIEGNEIYEVGRDGDDTDVAISICCGISGQFIIRKNYVHDIPGGILQMHMFPTENYSNLGHIIELNVFDRFGYNSYSAGVTYGKYAGIRLRNAPGTKIYNNVISNGGNALTANAVLLWDDATDVEVKNNIFYNNAQADIRGVYEITASGWSSNNNIFSRSDFIDAWWWEGTKYSTLYDWQLAQGVDANSQSVDPLFANPALNEINDFQLMIGSPAIEQGLDVGLNEDYLGNPIVLNPDVGAFEFQTDTDGDGVLEGIDNCPVTVNPDQSDLDNDGFGDVCDSDRDGDGAENTADCSPDNAEIYPGAVEIIRDGIDQDCNGFDLTTIIDSAKYKGTSLTVKAQSLLPNTEILTLDGYGEMSWTTKKGNEYWVLKVQNVANPSSVTVTSNEGTTQAFVVQ